jgi:hypothetical protein
LLIHLLLIHLLSMAHGADTPGVPVHNWAGR